MYHNLSWISCSLTREVRIKHNGRTENFGIGYKYHLFENGSVGVMDEHNTISIYKEYDFASLEVRVKKPY